MSLPKIDLSKVKTLSVEGPTLNVWYRSGAFRQFENVDLAAFKARADQAGKTIHGLKPAPAEPTEQNLATLLGLTPEQAQHLEGANRINFWRNGCLNVRVQHGSRAVKFACPKATLSDADLLLLFGSWGWQHLAPKLYFRPTAESSVRL